MLSDLDDLMLARNIDGIVLLGPGQNNPPMVYLTGGAHLTDAVLVKQYGQPALLFHRSMERDEASQTGLATVDMEIHYRLDQLMRENRGNVLRAAAGRLANILRDQGLAEARLAVYGQMDAGASFGLLQALQQVLPDLQLVGELDDTLLQHAMATKDSREIEHIRRMGQITTEVVGQVAEFLTSHPVQDQVLLKRDGSPLTIADVKAKINLWLAERGAENPRGVIFAIGRDSAVPHSSGNPNDLLRLGETIIFDIFPCEAGGGYFYDFTRTWCLGYAPDDALALYEDVLAAYQLVRYDLQAGVPLRSYSERVCDLFRQRGHPTQQDDPLTQRGFVHGLGHGLGLNLHEPPFFRLSAPETALLPAHVAITVEPGLYYPERAQAVRLEDTFWVPAFGKAAPLVEYPLDFVLPLKA